MKNNITNLLRGGIMMLAAVFAFAFTQPIENPNPRYTEMDSEWVLVTGQLGVNYNCNDLTPICTAELVGNDPELGIVKEGTEEFGVYVRITQ